MTSRDAQSARGWHPATRVAFRFCFLYFGLYVITTQMLEAFLDIPGFDFHELGTLPPARPLFLWIGKHASHSRKRGAVSYWLESVGVDRGTVAVLLSSP